MRTRLFRSIVVFGAALGAGATAVVGSAGCDVSFWPFPHHDDAFNGIADALGIDASFGMIDAAVDASFSHIADAGKPDGAPGVAAAPAPPEVP